MLGVCALESPYIEKNNDWSSQTSHKKFGDSCPLQYADINKRNEKRYIFKICIFINHKLIQLIILVSLKH